MKAKTIALIIAILMLLTMAGCGMPVFAGATPEQSVSEAAETASMLPTATPLATPAVPSGTPAASPSPTATPSPTPEPPEPLTVTERTLAYGNDEASVNIVYPEISGMADAAVQSGINEEVLGCLQDRADEVVTGSSEGGPHGLYTFETDFDVKRNDGVMLSVRIDISFYAGGASTGSEVMCINAINSDPAQQPTLAELFTEGADYVSVLNGKIEALIAAGDDADAFDFTGISSGEDYYLTDDHLVIVFPRNSITSSAYGEPEFAIPLAELEGILIPGIA